MLRDLKKNGFASIVEIIVTAIVFVIAAAGILSTMVMFRPQGQEASKKMEAAYIGKGIIDDLRQQVSAEDWFNAGSPLEVGTTSFMVDNYNVTYTITDPVVGDYRKLEMNVTWPDP